MTEDTYEKLAPVIVKAIQDEPFRLLEEGAIWDGELPCTNAAATDEKIAELDQVASRIESKLGLINDAKQNLELRIAANYLHDLAFKRSCIVGDVPRYAASPDAFLDLWEAMPFLLRQEDHRLCIDAFANMMQNKLKGYLRESAAAIRRPVELWRRKEVEDASQLDGYAKIILRMADTVGYKDTQRLIGAINKGIEERDLYVQELLRKPSQVNMAIGQKQTEDMLKYAGFSDPGTIHKLADELLLRLDIKQEDLREVLIEKHGLRKDTTHEGLLTYLKGKYRIPEDQVVSELQKNYHRLKNSSRLIGLVDIPDDWAVRIEKTPKYLENDVAFLMTFLPGLLRNKKETTCYVTPSDEMNWLNLTANNGNQAFGRPIQYIPTMDQKSEIRKWMLPLCLSEGFAIYMEKLLPGLFEDDLHDEVMYLMAADQKRVPARTMIGLAVKTGSQDYLHNCLHITSSKTDLYEACTEVLARFTGWNMETSTDEVESFSRSWHYLFSYLVGHHHVENAAKRFDDPAKFIKAVQKAGNVYAMHLQESMILDGSLSRNPQEYRK